MRGIHDFGGLPSGAVERSEHDYALWEKRIDALVVLLSNKNPPLIGDDELRRSIESLGADAYETLNYYERWIAALTHLLLEKGVLTVDELGRKIAEIEARDQVMP
jgi:hypothetical protein